MEFIKTEISESHLWNDFLKTHYNLFYDPKFLNYNLIFKKDIIFHHLVLLKNGKPVAIITGNERIENNKKIFVSCDGVSFGGIIWDNKCTLEDYIEAISHLKNYLSENNFLECIIRNPPSLYQNHFYEEYEYSLLQNDFINTRYSITNIINLKDFSFEKLNNPKKRGINKSSTLINIEKVNNNINSDNLRDIYELLYENRKLKNVTPTHTLEELVYLKNTLSDNIIIFKAVIENILCGMCVLFVINKEIVLNFYLAADEVHKRFRVSDFLLFKTIMWAKENNFRIYDIGTSNTGKVFLSGLFNFKKKFMADGYLRKTFKVNL